MTAPHVKALRAAIKARGPVERAKRIAAAQKSAQREAPPTISRQMGA